MGCLSEWLLLWGKVVVEARERPKQTAWRLCLLSPSIFAYRTYMHSLYSALDVALGLGDATAGFSSGVNDVRRERHCAMINNAHGSPRRVGGVASPTPLCLGLQTSIQNGHQHMVDGADGGD